MGEGHFVKYVCFIVKLADSSTKIYLDKINMLLDTYAPLRRINKYRLKFNSKPWTNLGSLANYITKKDPILKDEFLTKCKKIQIYSPPL